MISHCACQDGQWTTGQCSALPTVVVSMNMDKDHDDEVRANTYHWSWYSYFPFGPTPNQHYSCRPILSCPTGTMTRTRQLWTEDKGHCSLLLFCCPCPLMCGMRKRTWPSSHHINGVGIDSIQSPLLVDIVLCRGRTLPMCRGERGVIWVRRSDSAQIDKLVCIELLSLYLSTRTHRPSPLLSQTSHRCLPWRGALKYNALGVMSHAGSYGGVMNNNTLMFDGTYNRRLILLHSLHRQRLCLKFVLEWDGVNAMPGSWWRGLTIRSLAMWWNAEEP